MKRQSSRRTGTKEYESSLVLRRKLRVIESSLEEIKGQLKESNRRSVRDFRVGIGLTGLGAALGLSIASPIWTGGERHLTSVAFLLTGFSLAIVYGSLVEFVGDYRKRMASVGLLFMIMGPVVYMVSDIWLNIPWVIVGSIILFAVGLGMLPLSGKRKKEGKEAGK